MKKKAAIILCLLFCFSLISGIISYAATKPPEQKITSLEELPEEIRNSEWFKYGLEYGVYDSYNSLDMVGKYYMGEQIEDILLMSQSIDDFKPEEFFRHTVFSVYSLEDLKAFKEQGLNTMDEVYEKIYLPGKKKTDTENRSVLRIAGDSWTSMSVSKTRIESFQLPSKPPHGQLWNIKLDGATGFCAGYGMSARTGYNYQRTSNMTDVNIGSVAQERQIQQAIGFFVDKYEWQEQHWRDEGYLVVQPWIWMALEGWSDSEIAHYIPYQVFGSSLTEEQRANLKSEISSYQASGRKMDRGNVFFYRNPTVSGAQPVISYQGKPSTPAGWAKIKKQSKNPEITNGNSCYSLAGAQYGIFTDNACTNRAATLTTDNSGDSNTAELTPGTYYLKELKAPKGFALNSNVQQIEVTSGQTKTFNTVDIPNLDPIDVLLGKVDKETNANKPEGSASLAGAEFTVKFYEGYYGTNGSYYPDGLSSVNGLTPKYVMTAVTNSNGYGRVPDSQKPFVVNEFGEKEHGLPPGTLVMEETKAPRGYLISKGQYVSHIKLKD